MVIPEKGSSVVGTAILVTLQRFGINSHSRFIEVLEAQNLNRKADHA